MSYSAHVYRVMLASPAGLFQEREAVRTAIYEWNSDHAQAMGMVLLPVMWETDAHPAFGDDAQTIINRSVVDLCDMLVGFFGETLGTRTPRAASGTVEEIQKVHEAGKSILLYFGNRQVEAGSISPEKMIELRDFKDYCQKRSLYGEFTDASDLAGKVQRHLLREMRAIRFPPRQTSPAPQNYAIEGNQLTIRSTVETPDYFATEEDKETCVLRDVLVLLSARRITNMMHLLRVLEQVARAKRTLLLLTPGIAGEALATLALNVARGTLQCCPVDVEFERTSLLAVRDFTGGHIAGDLLRLEDLTIDDLGKAEKVIVEPNRTRVWK